MLEEASPLYEQIASPAREGGPIYPVVAKYAELIHRRGQDFLETSITTDRHLNWPLLREQVAQSENEARDYYLARIAGRFEDPKVKLAPSVQAAISRCQYLLTEEIDELSCTPCLLYSCCDLVKLLRESAQEFVPLGSNDEASHHANNALWFISQDWSLDRSECLISPSYRTLERFYRVFVTTPFSSWLRLQHVADMVEGRLSDASWCSPLILPPQDFPELAGTPLSSHKANSGLLFTKEYFDERAIIFSVHVVHEQLVRFLEAQENEEGPAVVHYGSFSVANGGEFVKVYGNELKIQKRYRTFLSQLILARGSQVDLSTMREAYGGSLAWANGVKYASDLRRILMDKIQRNVIVTDSKEGWRLDIGE